jgi:anti-anti-sigma factor
MNENLILVVDDEPDICGEISGFLSARGYQVIIAHNGNDAILLFKKQNPILVLTDYKMPGMNGIELLRRIKSINKEVHVVLISGAADTKTIVAAMKEEAFDFLMKPIDLSHLVEIVTTAISKTLAWISKDTMRRVSFSLISEVVEIGDTITVLYFNNDLDELTSGKYEGFIQKMINERSSKKNLVFILKAVKYINNIGLNFLIKINDFIKNKGYRLHLCSLSPQVDLYLRSLGYLDYFNVDNSLESLSEKIHLGQ